MLFDQQIFWVGVIFLPVFVAGLFLVGQWRQVLMQWAPWTVLPALLTAIFIDPNQSMRISWFLLNAQFGMDETAKVFLFLTALIWFIAGLYALFYLSDEEKKPQFFVFYLLSMCGNIGLILAQDVISFYFLFALMSLASYGLVVYSRTAAAHFAGKVYIFLVILGEACIFTSFLLAVYPTGNIYFSSLVSNVAISPMRDVIIFLALVGFGIKAGMLPLHVWLPLAHPVAPTPASAILSGAMINAGLFGWLKVFPLGEIVSVPWGGIMIVLGFLGAFYGVVVGLTQKQEKAVLAYSSISQMGVMTVILGIGFLLPEAWPQCWAVLMVYTTHHALAKAALFLSVGVSGSKISSKLINCLRCFGLILPALAIMGAPLTAGIFAKGLFKYLIIDLGSTYQWAHILKWLVIISAIGTAIIMIRFLWLIWPKQIKADQNVSVKSGVYFSWGLMLVAVIMVPFIIQNQDFVSFSKKVDFYSFKWGSAWPLLFAGACAWLAIRLRMRNPFCIPQGDILIIFVKILSLCRLGVLKFVQNLIQVQKNCLSVVIKFENEEEFLLNNADKYSEAFGLFRVFGVTFLVLFISLFILALG